MSEKLTFDKIREMLDVQKRNSPKRIYQSHDKARRTLTNLKNSSRISEPFKVPQTDDLQFIAEVVTEDLCISIDRVKGKSRSRESVFPRQAIIFFSWRFTNLGTDYIGYYLGGRDHSTVLHNLEAFEDDIDVSKSVFDRMKKIGIILFGEMWDEIFEAYKRQKEEERISGDLSRKKILFV